jgi:hypothetical protein
MTPEQLVELCTPGSGGDGGSANRHLWAELALALPLRDRKAVREYCQRRFMNKKTGPWQQQEVDTLRESDTHRAQKAARIHSQLRASSAHPLHCCRSFAASLLQVD